MATLSPDSPRELVIGSERDEEIAELAEMVADEHCPNGRVEPAFIAEANRITISYGHYEDAFDGLLEHISGSFHIFCNIDRLESVDRPRTRFTIAHELGHFYIVEHVLALRSGKAPFHGSQGEFLSLNPVEREADLFAANLLLPRRRFQMAAKPHTDGLQGILALGKAFGTSVTATAIRYASLDVRPCAIIKWNTTGRDWSRFSPSAYRSRYRKTIDTLALVPPGSATRKAFSDPTPTDGFFRNGTLASAWFPFLRPGEARDVLLIEEALPLGRYGALTLLYPESGAFPGQ